jgi:hypothetical protein
LSAHSEVSISRDTKAMNGWRRLNGGFINVQQTNLTLTTSSVIPQHVRLAGIELQKDGPHPAGDLIDADLEGLQQTIYVGWTAEPIGLSIVCIQMRRQAMALDECWQISRLKTEKDRSKNGALWDPADQIDQCQSHHTTANRLQLVRQIQLEPL